MHSRPVYSISLALLPLLFLFAACDSGGSNTDVNNEFTLTIEPTSSSATTPEAVSQATVNGFSFFYDAEHPETEEQAFGIYLSNDQSFSAQSSNQGLFGFVARASSRPGTGTYDFSNGETLQDSQFIGFLYEDIGNPQGSPFYVIDGGSLTLNESSNSKVSGSIEATGTAYSYSGSELTQEPVTVTGSFTAKDVETFVPFSTPGQ